MDEILTELTKKEWAHIISVLQIDSMTGNHQSKQIFKKLTSAMIRPDRTGEHNLTSDEPYNNKIKTIQPLFINKIPLSHNPP